MTLRFILKRDTFSDERGIGREFFTVDAECPPIEQALRLGGCSESAYDQTSLVGVEVLETP